MSSHFFAGRTGHQAQNGTCRRPDHHLAFQRRLQHRGEERGGAGGRGSPDEDRPQAVHRQEPPRPILRRRPGPIHT